MKKITLFLSLFVFSLAAFAQSDTTYWKTEGDFYIQFNQTSFTNWAAGGDNTYSGTIGLNYAFNYAKAKDSWDNKLILSYGMQSLGGNFQKTEDRIDFSSKYGRSLTEKTYFAVLFSLKTQFVPGYNYPNTTNYVSAFAAPLYTGIGPGIDYKPNKSLSFFLSPATVQWVIIADNYLANLGSFGNDPGQNVRTQFGANFKMQITKEIAKNIKLDTKVELFSDYLNNPQNIIVNWDFALDMKVNKFISAKLTTGLIYDDNITIYDENGIALGPRTQFKELFGAGLSVKF